MVTPENKIEDGFEEDDFVSEELQGVRVREVLKDLKRYLEVGPIKSRSDRQHCIEMIDAVL